VEIFPVVLIMGYIFCASVYDGEVIEIELIFYTVLEVGFFSCGFD